MNGEIKVENVNTGTSVFSSIMNENVEKNTFSTHLSKIGEKIWPGLILVGASIASRKVSPLLLNRLIPKFRVTVGCPKLQRVPTITNETIHEITVKANKEILDKHGFEPIVKEVSKKDWKKISKTHSQKIEMTEIEKKELVKQHKVELKNIYGSQWKFKSKKELKNPIELKYLEFVQRRRKNLIQESETKILPNDWKSSLQKLPGWKKTITKIEENQRNLILKDQDLAKFYAVEVKKNSEAFIEHFLTASTTALLYTSINSKLANEGDFSKFVNQNVSKLKEKDIEKRIALQLNHIEFEVSQEMEKIQNAMKDLPIELKKGSELFVNNFIQYMNEKNNEILDDINNHILKIKGMPVLIEESEILGVLKSFNSEFAFVISALFGRSFLMRKLIKKIPFNKIIPSNFNSKKIDLISLGLISVIFSGFTKAMTSPLITNADFDQLMKKYKAHTYLKDNKDEKQPVLSHPVYGEVLANSFATMTASFISQPILSEIVNVVLSAVIEKSIDPYTEQNIPKVELESSVKEHIMQIFEDAESYINGIGKKELEEFKEISEKIIGKATSFQKEQSKTVVDKDIENVVDKNILKPTYGSLFKDRESMVAFAKNEKISNFKVPVLKTETKEDQPANIDEIVSQIVLSVLLVIAVLAKAFQK
ncbi:MAG: hypothetical protein Q8K60_08865 [Parachlamydiaceae bacterium]|nr:hypothetical protein [Parachlamydiaceae bacterium]